MEVIERIELTRGMVVTIHDESKPVAGDRWLVRIRCEATIPLPQECVGDQAEEDAALKDAVLAKLGDTLTFAVRKERIFVDDREKGEVLAGLVADVRQNMLAYLAKAEFPARLFAKRYAENRAICMLERHYRDLPAAAEDEEGPADFSALFRK